MADRLEVIIEAIDKASADLRRIRGDLVDMGDGANDANQKITASSEGAIASLARLAIGFIGARAVIGAWSSSIRLGFQELVEGEQAEVRFVAALRNRGAATQQALNNARALADEMQRTAGVADDLTLSVQATLVQFGGLSGDRLTRATRAVLDLAATGKDASQVAFTLAKAASGVGTEVGRLGFKLDETLPAAQRFDDLLGQIEGSAGGTAAALGQTLGGQIARIGESFKNLAEAFVKIELARTFALFGGNLEGAIGGLQVFTKTFQIFADKLAGGGGNVADKMVKLGTGVKVAGEEAKTAAPPFKELGATVKTLGEHLSDISGASIPDFTQEAKGLADGMAETNRLFALGTISLKEYEAIMVLLAEQAEALEEKGIDVPFFDIEKIEEVEEAVFELTERQQLLADSVSNLGADFARMALTGQLSFRNLTQALRQFVAELIAALVRMAIFNALVSAFAGGGTTSLLTGAVGFRGGFATAPSLPNVPPAAPRLGAPGVAGVSINNSFLGVSERFVRDLNEASARLARQYGVQIVSSEVLA